MRIYWTIKSIPELSALPWNERLTAWAACCWRQPGSLRGWRFWALESVHLLTVALTVYLITQASTLSRGFVIFGAVLLLSFVYKQITYPMMRPYIRLYLQDKRVKE